MMIYLSGKIAGIDPIFVEEKFKDATRRMVAGGYSVLNPLNIPACDDESCGGEHLSKYKVNRTVVNIKSEYEDETKLITEYDVTYKHSWDCYIKHDVVAMLTQCDGLALLYDWFDSPGARLESYIAASCGLKVGTLHQWLYPNDFKS